MPDARGAMRDARLVRYDTGRYPFAALAARAFEVDDLGRLHDKPGLYDDGAGRPTYQDNVALRTQLRDRLADLGFGTVYTALMREVVAPIFGCGLAFSRNPQLRVHLAGGPSASAWHTDHQVLHRTDQINAWLPFVDAWGTNTLWVESDYGTHDYAPVPVRYGEILLFDGTFLMHGSVANDSGHTRVGMDFRFAPKQPGVLHDFLPSRARSETLTSLSSSGG
ncbi:MULTISPECIES: 2OG-Fe(II) oxygenase family protein [Catenuloplanes]|uniref:Streptomycin biosynthesis enzyme StrG n=1 Tax=Catenuloplanes niger TaxID=587534 RepID=A0AAE3ZKU2_9ACTN|nr:hypothetical protein [Catenuloplanes niger]MDR7320777.1 hypothetical protein [Catenuloplanes niger]